MALARGCRALLAQFPDFPDEHLYLLLLAEDGLVEGVEQVLGITALDLEFGQAVVDRGGGVHAGVGPDSRPGPLAHGATAMHSIS